MKIYSSRRNNSALSNTIDRFVGKGAWVKVEIYSCGDSYYSHNKIGFMRPITSFFADGCMNYVANFVNTYDSDIWECTAQEKERVLTRTHTYSDWDFHTVEPLEVHTTEELFKITNNPFAEGFIEDE